MVEIWTVPRFALAYVTTLVVLVGLDGLWLGWLAKGLYRREMGELMAKPPRIAPAVAFYLAYPLGVVFFALMSNNGPAAEAFMRCAALGLLAYATYDLTNASVIRGFSVRLAFADVAWGTLATGVAGTAAFLALH